jgi:hypothetical protein
MLAGLLVAFVASPARGEAVKVELTKTEDGWRLLREGQPYRIQGAGGEGSLEALAASGGNSVRTWDFEGTDELLDEAHRLGLTVTLGIWLGHQRHGFDYSDADQVAAQYERARKAVLRYRDHPAVLLWGVGNEMEGFGAGDDASVWSAVNNIAAMVKKLDPNHPTMTVVAEVGGERVKSIHRLCPDIDIVGINAYGGVQSLPDRYRKAGGTKPYVVTETGPAGPWEVGKTAWGAPIEPSSTDKAQAYVGAYRALEKDAALNLGSYVFLWGHKREGTATWFGMFLRDGHRTEAVDAMTEAWTGKAPRNRVPRISKLEAKTPVQVEPGGTVEARVFAKDRENDRLEVRWVLEPEEREYFTGGDAQPEPPPLPDAIRKNGQKTVKVKLPDQPGGYRLYAYVVDAKGGAAVANLPLRVRGEAPVGGKPVGELPLVVYGDGFAGTPYVPSGYMGNHGAITMDAHWQDRPHEGKSSIKVSYTDPGQWAGVVWQDPPNDWGERPGGYDLSQAKKLTFWARGERGGERVKFGFGLIDPDKPYPDTDRDETEVVLTSEWKQYTFKLKRKTMTSIKSGFYWVATGQGRPLTFYLDQIRYE